MRWAGSSTGAAILSRYAAATARSCSRRASAVLPSARAVQQLSNASLNSFASWLRDTLRVIDTANASRLLHNRALFEMQKLDGSTSEKQPDATPADQIVGHFETSHVVRFAWSPKNISCGEIGSSRFLNQLRVVHVVRSGGDGGIRTLDRALQPYNGLANRRLQPLGHVSGTADMPDTATSRKRQIARIRDSQSGCEHGCKCPGRLGQRLPGGVCRVRSFRFSRNPGREPAARRLASHYYWDYWG